jgi:hypothetical protein
MMLIPDGPCGPGTGISEGVATGVAPRLFTCWDRAFTADWERSRFAFSACARSCSAVTSDRTTRIVAMIHATNADATTTAAAAAAFFRFT